MPLIVETCTRIVEERGLNSIGVYRVPGNSGSVNALIDLLQKVIVITTLAIMTFFVGVYKKFEYLEREFYK